MAADSALTGLIGEKISVLLALPKGNTRVSGLLVEVSEQTLRLRSQQPRTFGREALVMLGKVAAVQRIEQPAGQPGEQAVTNNKE